MAPEPLLWLASILLAALAGVLFVAWRGARRSQAPDAALQQQLLAIQSALSSQVAQVQGAVRALEARVVETGGQVQGAVLRDLGEARRALESVRALEEVRRRLEEEVRASTRRIETVLAGSQSRGEAGENILREAFRHFPPGMLEQNFRVNGKPVEYALVLANKKRLAIDSKWPAQGLLAQLEEAGDPAARERLAAEVERTIRKKAAEAAQYIDPATTLPWAVAAVPDGAFAVCRQAHLEAFRSNVILMPYSMAVPYLLALYNLHLQYARSIDADNLESYLRQMERSLNGIERALENSVARGATMVANAYTECKGLVADMRGAIASLTATTPPRAIRRDGDLRGAAAREMAATGEITTETGKAAGESEQLRDALDNTQASEYDDK